ncbi:MAG: cupredoxin domain-containing protein [Nitrosotalea sp.]
MKMSKPFGALFGLLALVAILGVAPAFGQTASEIDMAKGAGASASADCVAANNCFTPNPMSVTPGTTVTWKNTDTVSHYLTSGKPSDETTGTVFDSGNLIKPGGTYQFTFANAGTYDYFCSVHPWMIGQVIVGASSIMPSTMSNTTATPVVTSTTMANMTATTVSNTTTATPVATSATMSNMTVSTQMSNTTATTMSNTTTSVANTATTPTETTTPVVTTQSATPQYATSQTITSPSPGPSSDEVAAWVAGIIIFAIVSGIGIWTAVRRR